MTGQKKLKDEYKNLDVLPKNNKYMAEMMEAIKEYCVVVPYEHLMHTLYGRP